MVKAAEKITEEKAALPSSSIHQALAEFKSSGPSGLQVRIGTKEITLTREKRRMEFARDASIDDLIDAAVDLTGPLTPDEIKNIIEPYRHYGVTYEIKDGSVYLTRKAHTAKVPTPDKKIIEVRINERTVNSTLDVPMAHVERVLQEICGAQEVFA